jgi:sporulation protein YlmC with PRC-barrel domain
MASDNMKHRRLQELGESDFEIVDGQPDIRGWDVRNERDQKIGEVEELILDAKNKKVRYLVVDLDDNDLDLDDREVLIPIGMAELHEDDDDVVVNNLTVEQLQALPEYDEDNLTPDVERNICMALGRTDLATPGASIDDDQDMKFYQQDQFNDTNLYRRRLPSAGAATGAGLGSDSTPGTSASGLTGENKYDYRSGYGLRDKSFTSGNESSAYQDNQGSSFGSGTHPESRGSMYREEAINEDAAVPVNRPRNAPDETGWSKETDIDNLTGDNNRGLRGDDLSRNDEDEIRRTDR